MANLVRGDDPVPAPPQKRYTYEDYLKINDDNLYELIGGELVLVPSPKTHHQRVQGKLYRLIAEFVDTNKLGEVLYAPLDVVLTEYDKPQPDILFISRERLSIIKENYIDGPPDLVVEVLSPGTQKYDRKDKSRLYFFHGVKEYWIVDPDARILEVYVPGEKDWQRSGVYDENEVLVSPLLPGLHISLKNVFARISP